MRQLFVSYARENKHQIDELVRDLDTLGYQTWVDSSLRGGQTWWEEIVRRIAECDAFLAIVSRDALNSVACKRELQWALALNKPVLPIAVERLPEALPRNLSIRQVVDYSQPGKQAAFALAGGLATLPPAPPPPEQLPEPPPAPLSYLSELIDQVAQPEPLTHEQQHQILIQLQPALRSADSEERQGGRYVLDMFSRRKDLYADVDRSLAQLGIATQDETPSSPPELPADGHDKHPSTASVAPAGGLRGETAERRSAWYRRPLVLAIATAAAVFLASVALTVWHRESSPVEGTTAITTPAPTITTTVAPAPSITTTVAPAGMLGALGAAGIDFSVPEADVTAWLNNPELTSYPAIAEALLKLLDGDRLRQPVYLDVIVFNYEQSPGNPSPRKVEEVNLHRRGDLGRRAPPGRRRGYDP